MSASHSNHSDSSHHIVSASTNLTVFLSLVALTVITVGAAQIDFGGVWNIVIALAIACVKASIVLLWFMHLKYDSGVNRVIFGSAVFFVALFFGLTATDVFFR